MLNVRENSKSLKLFAIKINQPVGTFFSAKVSSSDLYEIAKFDIRRIALREGIDEFLGIQREVSSKRLKEIKEYIVSKDATFPTAVIIAVDERCARFEPQSAENPFGTLILSNFIDVEKPDNDILYRDIAKIIDGQHRVKAFENGFNGEFELNLSVFVGADIATQAEIFSTVNLAQTKVNRSLVYDLFSLSHTRSPEKTAHEITVLLDQKVDSPFYRRIKRLGVATEGRFGETLSQATVVRGILVHITKTALIDRDIGKRQQNWKFHTGDELKFVFRYHFTQNRDDIIFLNIFNYFAAVSHLWGKAWANNDTGSVLPKTNGYFAFMRFIKLVNLSYSTTPSLVPNEHYLKILSKVRDKLEDDHFTTENYKPGTSGESQLFSDLVEYSGLGSDLLE